jgi:hypothetical protein
VSFKLSTLMEGASCSIAIDRVREGVILVRIVGHDVGEFGDSPMRCIESFVPVDGTAVLFIDARNARGVSVDVSGAWARWLGQRRQQISTVHMLTSSKLVEVSAGFVRRFTELGSQMQLYTDPLLFERSLVQASA